MSNKRFASCLFVSLLLHMAFLWALQKWMPEEDIEVSADAYRLTLRLNRNVEVEEALFAEPIEKEDVDSAEDKTKVPQSAQLNQKEKVEPENKEETPSLSTKDFIRSALSQRKLDGSRFSLQSDSNNEREQNIFDSSLRQKLSEIDSATGLAPEKELFSYIGSAGDTVQVRGDNCFTVKEADDPISRGMQWSMPSKCPWVKTESEKLIGDLRSRLN